MIRAAVSIALVALAGCASVTPTSVRVYAEHVSHITQHEPFTDRPEAYGYQSLNVEAHWQHGPAFLDIGEGYNLNRVIPGAAQGYGALLGPREIFHARAGVEFRTGK